jgi:hypothetical protein
MGGRALGRAQLGKLRAPARELLDVQPLHDERIHHVRHEHFGQHELILAAIEQRFGGLVGKAQQLLAWERFLEGFDALEDVFLVALLLGRQRPTAPGFPAGVACGQHARKHESMEKVSGTP